MAINLIAQRGSGEGMALLIIDTQTQIGVVYENDNFFQGIYFQSILARGYWEEPTKAAKDSYAKVEKRRIREALKDVAIPAPSRGSNGN